MKKSYSFFLTFFVFVFSLPGLAQDENPRYKKFKEWKLNFILDNLELTPEEEEHFHCIFNTYEDEYHSKVWTKERQIKKQVEESFDTIKSQSASKYITEYHELEKLGLTIKNERNQKMLNKIRTKEVLNFLSQEQRFDQEMFKRIRDNNKKKEEKKKKE
jgi:hypothetical protein|tara:strand:- start:177 stop:653 length:477 start_codon:yes stop_codon:yes gene_type:complete